MDSITQRKFSRLLSFILRHDPEKFGLETDEEGFIGIADIIDAVKVRREWRNAAEDDVRSLVDKSERSRFEIRGDAVRATYGHTLVKAPVYPAVDPPEFLYHGTARRNVPGIREKGLLPAERAYVHLSPTEDVAIEVGLRHDDAPAILKIRAAEAAAAGHVFHHPIEEIYLTREMPAGFIEFDDAPEDTARDADY